MHTYWSKKPHDAIRQYIRHYTKPGDLVLDPFCGSGSTALAALMEGRAAIAIDLSPAATFITKNYCTPVDLDELQYAFEELKCKVEPEMRWLYETRCDRCDGRATTIYTVYSQIFQCPRCLEKVPLFDCIETDGQTSNGKIKRVKVCPYCYQRGHSEEIRSQSQKFGYVPVLVSYSCEEGCKPHRSERRYNDLDPKKKEYFEKYDLGKLEEIAGKQIPYPFPQGCDMTGFNRYQRDALRLYGVHEVADLFTKRNLWALSAIKHSSKFSSKHLDFFLFAFTGIIFNCSRLYRYRPNLKGGFQAGMFYVPQEMQIINVWRAYKDKIQDLISGFSSYQVNSPLLISTQSATRVEQIENDSVDYIFTDPPYADKVQYGELNFVWESWLDLDTAWHSNEIIVNETRGKTDTNWAELMYESMSEAFRVLKPGRWISLCYHDTSEGTWQLMQDLMAEIGFIPEKSEGALYIDTGQKSFNQLMAEKVTKRDLVINFRKPRPGEVSGQLSLFDPADLTNFQEAARLILTEALTAHPGTSADRLYDELVGRTVRKG